MGASKTSLSMSPSRSCRTSCLTLWRARIVTLSFVIVASAAATSEACHCARCRSWLANVRDTDQASERRSAPTIPINKIQSADPELRSPERARVRRIRSIRIFRYEYDLLAEMKRSLALKKRVFVTSNAKRRIDRISAAIAEDFGESVRQIKITSDSIPFSEVKAFIKAPSEQAVLYDLILTSPSLGTGIDITFEDQGQLIDVVYGFFDAMITTHFDFDQQLARVRHPGAIDVWVSPRWFRIRHCGRCYQEGDASKRHGYQNLLVSIDKNYRPVYLRR